MMGSRRKKSRAVVRRERAEGQVLTFLVAFAVTVIVTRVHLELAVYPQLGNRVLHLAHALWGGLPILVSYRRRHLRGAGAES